MLSILAITPWLFVGFRHDPTSLKNSTSPEKSRRLDDHLIVCGALLRVGPDRGRGYRSLYRLAAFSGQESQLTTGAVVTMARQIRRRHLAIPVMAGIFTA